MTMGTLTDTKIVIEAADEPNGSRDWFLRDSKWDDARCLFRSK